MSAVQHPAQSASAPSPPPSTPPPQQQQPTQQQPTVAVPLPSGGNHSGNHSSNHSSNAAGSGASGSSESDIYGMLVVLGCNGHLPGDSGAGRRTSRLLLRRRPNGGNALRPTKKQWRATSIKELEGCRPQASVSYTLGRNQGFVVVEYEPDAQCDMFQVGRSTESVIDLVVSDSTPPGESAASDSTISRYACRILVNRTPPYTPRIFAAGFDSNKRIMLGEHAIRWNVTTDEVDGLTTNGVLINKPVGGYCPGSQPGPWFEVSIEGRLYPMREHRATPSHSDVLHAVDNSLIDGTVIDLCGVCLVYRSAEGLRRSPTLLELCSRVESLNQTHILCPVRYQTLVIRKPLQANPASAAGGGGSMPDDRQPYVYTGCGHVHGLHSWDRPGGQQQPDRRTCPLCLQQSAFIALRLGEEAALYLDRDGMPNYAFNPCGHMASELTVKYWSALPLLTASQLRPLCPFCSTPLATPATIRLLFQSDI
ncbi:hypothetical protein BOX15_Mlig014249g1 [Macrostomum lignano]|uniref:Pellino n=2 Tax=Macrostomum lignano TaxID=282301 RepID=A0A267DN09_9PLAT|nr:hypothetical protein BOX15_Mlig014249g1 [Macrostomum lignano]